MSKTLDCMTPRGRESLAEQREVIQKLSEVFGFPTVLQASDDNDSAIDAILGYNGIWRMAVEVKSRKLSAGRPFDLKALIKAGSYLVTYSKLEKGQQAAMLLRVPFYLVVRLACGTIAFWQITDADGRWTTKFDCRISQTQKTCNGGTTERNNAYVSLDTMGLL